MANQKSEELKRELARRANDTIRVHNTTATDHVETYSGYNWIIPSFTTDKGFGNGNNDIPRHVADNYITHMADKVLTTEGDDEMERINAQRRKRGQPEMTPQERERAETPYRTDNPEKRAEVIKSLWVGLITKYGGDLPVEKAPEVRDTRPLDQKILDDLESKVVEDKPEAVSPDKDLETKKETLAREVA